MMEVEVEEEEEEEEEEEVDKVDAEVEAWQMTPIEQACLEFCIKLLNQHHHTHEYKSMLVCAMAVQGWGPSKARWRDPSSYPPILSRVIKVARFMVVQKALCGIIHIWVGSQKPGNSPIPWPLASADDAAGIGYMCGCNQPWLGCGDSWRHSKGFFLFLVRTCKGVAEALSLRFSEVCTCNE
jgi:hypothetical protein